MIDQLLQSLHDRANGRGLVTVRERGLCQELGLNAPALRDQLHKLENAGLIELLEPGNFLVLKLHKWRNHRENAAEISQSPYSYSFKHLQSNGLNNSNSYRDEQEEARQALLKEILDVLGENDPALFRKAVELYTPHVIRTALSRVRSARTIHKSRTALFRHLVPRFAKELQSTR